ncbi:MAG: hypothetical protein GF350_13680 [Chitinivibrionales bacterium]|nr:hypothetical protein [Chitinivibrionales bacterium]
MADVCKDAEDFEREYISLPAEEQKELEPIYNTLRSQCADAVRACKRSRKEKR